VSKNKQPILSPRHRDTEKKTVLTTNGTKKHEIKPKPNAVDFIFLRKNHSPHEGVQAAGAKTNSHFSPRRTQRAQRKNLQQIAAHRAIIC
jgi:hypothetical protein